MSAARTLLTAALLTALVASAEPLPDPTRPGILPAASTTGSPVPEGERTWVLQSVRLGPGRAQAAVISGQLVQVGGRLGDARLVRVTERHAVLEGPLGQTTLWLIKDVDKQDGSPLAAAAARDAKPATQAPPAPLAAPSSAPLAAPSRIAEVTP